MEIEKDSTTVESTVELLAARKELNLAETKVEMKVEKMVDVLVAERADTKADQMVSRTVVE